MSSFIARLLPALLALTLSACGPAVAPAVPPLAAPATAAPAAAAGAAGRQTITDIAGRQVSIVTNPERIISLAPSTTEILFALGLGPKVIAVDSYSNYPADAAALPKIGTTTGDYNYEQLVDLGPDLILAAAITPPEAIATLEGLQQTVVVVGATETTFESIYTDIALVGAITSSAAAATQLTAAMRQQFDTITAAVGEAANKPRVYWEIDATDVTKPYTIGPGSFLNELITLAGGVNIFADASSPYPQVSGEQVVVADPEVIILADAGFGVTPESVAGRPGWGLISAVREGRISAIDTDTTSRPGPRIMDGLEEAARLIHPERFEEAWGK